MDKPEEFKKEFIDYLLAMDFRLMPWQLDVIDRMTKDFALVTQQLTDTAHTHAYSIPAISDICKPCPPPYTEPCKKGWATANKEEVTPMASYASATVVNPASIETEQREIVRSALRTQREKLRSQFRKDFGLVDDDEPRTAAELIKRITDGQYTVDAKRLDEKTWNPIGYVRWRDPSKVEDKAGLTEAEEKLDAAYADAKLKAALLPVADLLQLVEDFKAFKA